MVIRAVIQIRNEDLPVPSRPADSPIDPAGIRPFPSSSHAHTTGSGSIADAGVSISRRLSLSEASELSESLVSG